MCAATSATLRFSSTITSTFSTPDAAGGAVGVADPPADEAALDEAAPDEAVLVAPVGVLVAVAAELGRFTVEGAAAVQPGRSPSAPAATTVDEQAAGSAHRPRQSRVGRVEKSTLRRQAWSSVV